MFEFPLPLSELFGHWGSYAVYAVIGIGFGFILESAGFGNSKKLAAQFYFKDMTVFKVMFTTILVAMVLIFMATGVGILDYNLIWVPPTYLWPGIVGGFIMGIGFIIGGFCPGTSLVGLATGKIDAIYFVGGVLVGIFAFGETVSFFDVFFNSYNYGRFTLPELFNASYGTTVFVIIVVALMFFWLTEKVEAYMNPSATHETAAWLTPAAAALIVLAAAVMFIGQPTNQDRWDGIATEAQAKLDNRDIQISPAELLDLTNDSKLKPVLLDVRDEIDYNQFHIHGARLLDMDDLLNESQAMQFELANTVFVLIGNDETRATEAWKILKAESIPNLYILEGGINNWLGTFADANFRSDNLINEPGDDRLAYHFKAALGDRFPASEPEHSKIDLKFEPKIILELKLAPTSGGCG
ncbi:MAG: YeeE/YedE family protein [Proteobacteria bacterium]|nr:YeeE/YedE family protein [Pseudomonadota bacterium]